MAGPLVAFQTGVHGSRPAASSGCVWYWCTTHSKVYRSDGTSWADLQDLSALSGGYAPGGTDVAVADGGTGSSTASGARTNLGLAIGSDVQAFDADIPTVSASQAEMEAGTEAALRSMSPLRVAQAIAALASAGSSGVEPWQVPVDVFTPHGQTNWTNLNSQSGEISAWDIYSSGAQNDEIYWDLGISAGTWSIVLWHVKAANQGIYTVSIDGSSVGTIDGYAAGTSYNNKTSITGVSIGAGKRRLKLKMATKNASASSYFGEINHLTLNRTA